MDNAHGNGREGATLYTTCEAVVLHCIDFRFRDSLYKSLKGRYPQGYDLVSFAGGVKGLLEEGPSSKALSEQFGLSCKLHNPSSIVLVQHEDCGAYGGSGSFESFREELAFQQDQMRKAADILSGILPDKTIRPFFIRLSGELLLIQ